MAGNTAFSAEVGATLDTLTDFDSGTDTLQLLSSVFGGFTAGTLTDGVNFSVISDSYDGTNAVTNLNYGLVLDSVAYSQADGVLHDDDKGSGAGCQAVAAMDQPVEADIEIVAAA